LRQIRRRLMNQKQKSQPMKVGFLLIAQKTMSAPR